MKSTVVALLDPTSCIPLSTTGADTEELLRHLEAVLTILSASNGRANPAVCEDTALVIMERHGDLQARGGYYRQCAVTLALVAVKHLFLISRTHRSVPAELAVAALSAAARQFTRDDFANFSGLAVSAELDESIEHFFVIANRFSLLPLMHETLTLDYIDDGGDLESCTVKAHSEMVSLLDRYGLMDPQIQAALQVTEPVKYSWEKTGHTPSERQRRVIETVAEESKVVIRSASIYHNPNGRSDKSYVYMRDKLDEIFFYVCDNNDQLGGVYKTRATTSTEAKTCLQIVEKHFMAALDRFT